MEQSRERSCALPLHLGVVAIEKGTFGSQSTKVANFTFFYLQYQQTSSLKNPQSYYLFIFIDKKIITLRGFLTMKFVCIVSK